MLVAGVAAPYQDDVYLSTNNGANWTAVSSGLTHSPITAIAVSGTNLFAAIGGNEGVFLSTNNGTDWVVVNTGLTSTKITELAVSGTNLFAGTLGGGVFLSTNNGIRWTTVNSGLTNTNVLSLAVSGANLVAGTGGSGVWMRQLSEFEAVHSTTPVPSSFSVNPNPFSSKTTLRFSSAARGVNQISVVNLLGQEVARLFSGELASGEHTFAWDASGMPAGMYMCVVRRNGGVEQVPMMLVR